MKDFKNFTAFEVPEDGLEDYLETFIDSRKKDLEDIEKSLSDDDYQNVKKIYINGKAMLNRMDLGGLGPLHRGLELR